MKFIYSVLVACLFIPTQIIAQNAKGNLVEMGYVRLPATPLQGNFDSYSVKVIDNAADLPELEISAEELKEQYFNFKKYNKVSNGGDFKVVAQLSRLGYPAYEVIKGEKTEGSGDNAKTVNYYYVEVSIDVPLTYQIKDGKRQVMVERNADYVHTFEFGDASSVRGVARQWSAERKNILPEERRNAVFNAVKRLSNRLNSDIDERVIKVKKDVFYIKKAKKYDLEDFDDALETAKASYPASSESGVSNDVTSDMASAVKIWADAAGDYSVENKKEVNIAFVANMNLATYHAIAGNLDEASRYILEAEAAKTKKVRVANMRKLIADLENRAAANAAIPNTYVGKYDSSASDDDDYIGGAYEEGSTYLVDNNGKKYVGDVVLKWGNAGVRRVLFHDANAGADAEPMVYKPEEIKSVTIRKNEYVPVSVPSLENPLAKNYYFCQKLDEVAGKVGLFEAKGSYLFVFYGAGKKGKDKVYHSDGLKLLNLNKGLASLFEGCSVISGKATEKKYLRNELSYRSVIEDYKACK